MEDTANHTGPQRPRTIESCRLQRGTEDIAPKALNAEIAEIAEVRCLSAALCYGQICELCVLCVENSWGHRHASPTSTCASDRQKIDVWITSHSVVPVCRCRASASAA